MGRWYYRPCKTIHENGEETLDVRACYYDNEGNQIGWSREAIYPFGETLEELKSDIERIQNDVETKELFVLRVYTCKKCSEKDSHTDLSRELCDNCLAKQAIK